MKALGLAGPLMVSPGTPEQLARFLELLPEVPKGNVFVDNTNEYEAFSNMGFVRMGPGMEAPKDYSLKAPNLSGGDILAYLGNSFALAPVRDLAAGIPEGVKQLGGTLVVESGRVVYASADRLPGDYPAPADVLQQYEVLASVSPTDAEKKVEVLA